VVYYCEKNVRWKDRETAKQNSLSRPKSDTKNLLRRSGALELPLSRERVREQASEPDTTQRERIYAMQRE
jgi:hypothetical protein